MISLDQILTQYPEQLRLFRESILKEYLQYKILKSIFDQKSSEKLVFLGGTALRIIHGSTRFSEDLDFDNFDLDEKAFFDLGERIKKDLELEGLQVEITFVTKNAYHLKIRIPGLLFDLGLSPIIEQKILIQVDSESQNYHYIPDRPILNKFEVFSQINAVPKNLLLTQKIFASVNRNRPMGRDFFDILFLYGIDANPDFEYLGSRAGVYNEAGLKDYLLDKTSNLDFTLLAQDVEPLLFYPPDKNRLLLFREFIEQQYAGF